MRTPSTLVVQEEHVEALEQLLRTGKTERRVAYRARIVLLRGEGLGPSEVAKRVGCDPSTVWRIEKRYCEAGLEALHDRPRSGRPRTISPPAKGANGRARLPKPR